MRTTLIIALAWIALVNTGTLLFLWWQASPMTGGAWKLLIMWDAAGEAWLEGVLLHLCLLTVALAMVRMKWLLRGDEELDKPQLLQGPDQGHQRGYDDGSSAAA